MRVFFLFLASLCTFLTAEDNAPPSLVDLSKSPIPRVAGSVNLVSGNFVEQTLHQETSGIDPYCVGTSYISSSDPDGSLGLAWNYYHATTLTVTQTEGIGYVNKPSPLLLKGNHPRPPTNPTILKLRDTGGAVYIFKGDNCAGDMKPDLEDSGYTYMSSIDTPFRRDIKRADVRWGKHRDVWKIRLGDGTKRLYRLLKDKSTANTRSYYIVEERLPSGNKRLFSYDKKNRLETITTMSSDGKLKINKTTFHKRGHIVYVNTSDNMSTSFHLKLLSKENQTVAKILSAGAKDTIYSYEKKESSEQRLIEKTHNNGSEERVFYYKDGINYVGSQKIVVDSSNKDFLHNRVRTLQTKAFPKDALSNLYNFYYRTWKKGHFRAIAKEGDGYSLKILWDPQKRAIWSGHFDPKDNRLFSEKYTWGTGVDEGRLIRRTISDSNKNPVLYKKFGYDAAGNVIREAYQGRFTGFHTSALKKANTNSVTGGELFVLFAKYSKDGRSLKIAESDPLGNWTYYEYEPKRALLTARFTCDQKNIIQREFFTYNSAAVCIESIADDGSSRDKNNLASVSRRTIITTKPRLVMPYFGSPDEKKTYFWTKKSGKKLSLIEKNFRDSCGRIKCTQIIDAAGVVQKTRRYSYDSANRVVETIDPVGRQEATTYDSSGRVASKTAPEATTRYTYDLLDRLIEEKKVFPDGSTESSCTQYDLTGKTVTKIDSRGRETTTYQDNCGRLVEQKLPSFSVVTGGAIRNRIVKAYSGTEESTTLPNGSTTKILRSAIGKPLKSTNAHGDVTRYYYDLKGRLIKQVDPSGLTTVTTYDSLDRVTSIETACATLNFGRIIKRYVGFDLVEETYPTKVIRYAYDHFGRKISQTTIDTIANTESVISYSYDTLHRPIKTLYHDTGVAECCSYDAADHVIEKRVVGSDGTILSLESTTYDLAGRIIEQGVARAGTIAKTQTIYGAYGLPIKIIQPDGSAIEIRYKPLWKAHSGELYLKKTTIDPRGVVTEELFDANDQQRDILVKNCLGEKVSHRGTSVNELGKPVLIGDDVIVKGKVKDTIFTKLDYDNLGQLTECTLAANTPDKAVYRYVYDASGHKIQDVKPSGVSINSTYDAKGRLTRLSSSDMSIDYQYTYNIQDLPEKIFNSADKHTTVRTYDGLGHLTHEQLENDLSISYAVDISGRLQSIIYPDSTTATYSYRNGLLDSIARKDYLYQVNDRDDSGVITSATLPSSAGLLQQAVDIMGRRTLLKHPAFTEERTSFDPVGNCLGRTIDGLHESFSYDALCQLTNDAGKKVSFDSLNRRIQSDGIKSSHNARHQMVTLGNEQLYYDIDGRRTKDATCTYTYDALDRLIAIEDASTHIKFEYDSFNRRTSSSTVRKDIDTFPKETKELYLYQQDCEIGSYVDGKVQSLRLLGEGLGGEIGGAVAFEINDELLIPIHDLSGNVRACLNRFGDVVEKLSYTSFGPESSTIGLSPWTFASKRQDPHFGLMYFGQRFYDPHTATWLTQDPLGYSAGPNLYAYVRNNPLTRFDAFGLFDFGCIGDFFSSVWDSVCDFVGGVASGISDFCSSFSKEPELAPHEKRDEDGRRYMEELNGDRYYKDEKYKSGIILHPYGDFVTFRTEIENGHAKGKTHTMFRGVIVSAYQATRSADIFLKKNKDYDLVITCYNSTNGFAGDSWEAGLNAMGWELAVGRTLREQLMSFFKECTKYGIDVSGTVCAHSQGVAIFNNIYNNQDFRDAGFHNMFSRILCLGGPVLVQGAQNVMAFGDPVCLLALLNIVGLIQAISDNNLQVVFPTTLEFPHNFEGSAYQNACDAFFSKGGH